MRISILGAGSWGTAFGFVLAQNGSSVLLYGRKEEDRKINTDHISPLYPDVLLPLNMSYTTDFSSAVLSADALVFAVPSKSYFEVAEKVGTLLKATDKKVHVLSLAKGFDPETQERLSSVLRKRIPEEKRYPIVSLLGPSFSEEVIMHKVTAITAVSLDEEEARRIQHFSSNQFFRVYTNTDEIGAECSSALKNVMAIASGILDGLKEGNNAKAALITRGLHEMTVFGTAMGGRKETYLGLSGVGDLVLTCSSPLSRNYTLGKEIGEEDSAEKVLASNHKTTEGVFTSKYASLLAEKLGIDMPITDTVYKILFEGLCPSKAIPLLMNRTLKSEK